MGAGGVEGLVVASGGARNSSRGNLLGDLVGDQDKVYRGVHAVGDGSGDIRVRLEGVWIFWEEYG